MALAQQGVQASDFVAHGTQGTAVGRFHGFAAIEVNRAAVTIFLGHLPVAEDVQRGAVLERNRLPDFLLQRVVGQRRQPG